MAESFRAFVVNKTDDAFEAGVKELSRDDLPAGEVLIKVVYSGINYKDGLASIPNRCEWVAGIRKRGGESEAKPGAGTCLGVIGD